MKMSTFERAAFLAALLFHTASCFTGQTNVTKMPSLHGNSTETPTSPLIRMNCHCNDCGQSGRSCRAKLGCFSALEPDDNGRFTVKRGCIDTPLRLRIICQNAMNPIYCCDKSWCNWNITPPFPTEPPTNSSSRIQSNEGDQNLDFILLSIFSPVAVLVLLIVIMCLIYKHLQKKQLRKDKYPNLGYTQYSGTGNKQGLGAVLECWSCQSDSEFHPLAQRTSAQDLDLIKVIGEGKFAKVWRGLWHGDDVAVKLFHPSKVEVFNNEVSVNSVVGNQQNILRLQHSHSAFSWNQITYSCIVMEYHENGSLFDLLNHRTVNIQEMCSLALSAARGLSHLHGEIYRKDETFSIAHCDIKSKNILVKANLTCAIGGLGLAVVDKWKDEISLKKQNLGTPRYMAPEILDDTVFKSFESYKRADMYSFGLVIWEIVKRTLIEGKMLEAYELPYHGMVPAEPTAEDMKKIVVSQQKRPFVPNRWSENSVLESVVKMMRDCWKQNAPARLSSLRVKKNLSKLMEMVKPAPSNTTLSQEYAIISDVNIHIPETSSENHGSVKV
ncbi:activin receptor type-1-like isoform X1 [Montipora capricornis]|uniref:activin receptor type-1-like isoform X1 n=2 Tax=Montipora capricornis TaxID=246305 RepID=UPI0035F141D4